MCNTDLEVVEELVVVVEEVVESLSEDIMLALLRDEDVVGSVPAGCGTLQKEVDDGAGGLEVEEVVCGDVMTDGVSVETVVSVSVVFIPGKTETEQNALQ